MQNIFLSQNIKKLCKDNKVEMLQTFELITYLAATKQISLQDAQEHTSTLFNMLEDLNIKTAS